MIKIFFTVLLLTGSSQLLSQKVKTGKNKLIFHSKPNLPIVESHIAVHPCSSRHMVVAAIVFDSAQASAERTHVVVFATKNNGRKWKQTDLSMKVGFDPWVAIRNTGEVGLVALAGYGSSYRNGLVYFYSADGGITWNEKDTVNFGGGHDHATMMVDSRNQYLYILSSISRRDSARQMQSYAWLTSSSDWRMFKKPFSYHVGAVNSNTLTVTIDDAGRILLPWVEYAVVNERAKSPVYKYVHHDGNEFSGPYFITDKAGIAKGFAVTATFKGRTYFVKNTGETPVRSNGIFLQYMDSTGGTWSSEVRVDKNEDREKFMRTAAIAVNKNGVVGIAWVDRRNDTALKKNDIYFAASFDGGKSFSREVRVTNINSDPATRLNGKAGERFISGGDYIGCVARPDGSFQLVWADSRSGVFQLYTSRIKIK